MKSSLPHTKGGYSEPISNEKKMESIARDFRSDTVTAPTKEMFEFMKGASIGDDVYGEDKTTADFQEKIAKLTGKEAALFCVSGTMTNQLAIRTWLTQPPHSVLCDSRAHIHNYEAGGIAFHSQATTIPVIPSNTHTLTLEDVEQALVLSDDIHFAPTKLVCLENTIRGLVHPQDEVERISKRVKELGIIMHCDGARIWEASAKTGLSIKKLCDPFDSVSLCLSKGLGAPIGSVLVGPRDLIKKANWFRKMFGGGIRQCGSIVAAADYCLINNFPRLKDTHRMARYMAEELEKIGVKVIIPVETNHVFIDTNPIGISSDELSKRAEEVNIRLGCSRIIVHIQIEPNAINDVISLVKKIKNEKTTKQNGNMNK
ncbi:pyridoxal phosphate-dependent transferase [Phakopsora pachyrhizi]|uniref:Pyridoxal phosphate-dependent transferase n=1 Tax=Phakopsora pachyrhizi TaxID=170000 RepID=A0AAV0BYG1_PHAPC|nr:pyridoxal phosphate-dependent transferase [Phakopsora pachyrhizi]